MASEENAGNCRSESYTNAGNPVHGWTRRNVKEISTSTLEGLSEANGQRDMTRTVFGDETSYLAVVLPNGKPKISDAITHTS